MDALRVFSAVLRADLRLALLERLQPGNDVLGRQVLVDEVVVNLV